MIRLAERLLHRSLWRRMILTQLPAGGMPSPSFAIIQT